MNICKVWDGDYPWDVRVEKVASALQNAGHTVHLVARNRGRLPVTETLSEATVHRLPPLRLLPRRLDATLMFPAFFNPRWLGAITRVARRNGCDLLLCRDLPLAPTSIHVARRLGLPVIMDMAENYPAMMQSLWESGCQGRMDWLVRNPRMVAAVERWVLHRLDAVVVVVEESKERLVRLGVPADRVVVVGNTPPASRLEVPDYRRAASGGDGQPLRIVYLGLLEAPRGLSPVIEAVRRSNADGVPVELSLVGDGRERAAFETQAREFDPAGTAVRFHGRLPYTEALEVVRKADVGVVPHVANESWNTTIPNKLFDYMSLGLPVLTSDARPAARVVREVGCGEVFSTVDELVASMRQLAQGERRSAYARRGREAVEERYHWEKDAARLVALVEAIARWPKAA